MEKVTSFYQKDLQQQGWAITHFAPVAKETYIDSLAPNPSDQVIIEYIAQSKEMLALSTGKKASRENLAANLVRVINQ